MEQQTAPVNQYASLCAQAGETAFQIASLQARQNQLLLAIDQLRVKEQAEQDILARVARERAEQEKQADEAGA